MNNIIGITDKNKDVITVGSKCYNCIFLKALKISNNNLIDDIIVCGKLNKEVKNTKSYCKYKEERKVEFKVGDKVKTKSGLRDFTKYKGISYFDYMYLDCGIITEIDEMYNKKVYYINGFSYTDEMLEKVEKIEIK